jgi:hypothetical protein
MIQCPNCNHQEMDGALFCSECGSQIPFRDNQTTQTIRKINSNTLPARPTSGPLENRPHFPGSRPLSDASLKAAEVNSANGAPTVSLHLVESGQIVPLFGRAEFTLGRMAAGQPILPDVDLAPYEAYTLGVSRLHAAIKIIGQSVVISDLGSSNGTRVNGQKIAPQVEFPLKHGDVVTLGKLKFQIYIRI